jgi:hypothetical protein
VMSGVKQEHIGIQGDKNKIVAGDDHSTEHHYHSPKQTKLTLLFDKLKEKFEQGGTVSGLSDDLKRYTDGRDTIGLEQKLKDANKEHLLDDFSWLKQQYTKKLTKFQFYEPAQEIHSYILGIVCERFRNYIYPLIRQGAEEKEIMQVISDKIVAPILALIQEEGCNDVMGLSSAEIEGMIHFLTGRCHLKWKL